MRLPTGPDETAGTVRNPLTEDFSVAYAHDTDAPILYTIHAGEAQTYPKYLADHIAKHLTHALVMGRGIKTNYDAEFTKALHEEVLV